MSRPAPRRPAALASAPAVSALPYAATAHGLSLAIKVTPKAAAERIEGIVPDADGSVRLKLAVTAPADGGRANAAVIALLARTLDLPASAFRLDRGASGRRKTLTITGDGAELAARAAARLACRLEAAALKSAGRRG